MEAHTHPGDCVGSLVEGAVERLGEGREPTVVPSGEGYKNLGGTVHGFRNVGQVPAKLVNSFVVDKGEANSNRPLALPSRHRSATTRGPYGATDYRLLGVWFPSLRWR